MGPAVEEVSNVVVLGPMDEKISCENKTQITEDDTSDEDESGLDDPTQAHTVLPIAEEDETDTDSVDSHLASTNVAVAEGQSDSDHPSLDQPHGL
jgi:hypothetical protein